MNILSWHLKEIEHYLSRMQKMWHFITDGNGSICDESTIQKLQGLAPHWSSRDRSVIEELFDTNQLFPRVSDRGTRAQILQKLLSIDGIILSFQTFYKHVKILEPVMLRLRELFPAQELFPPRGLCDPLQRRLPSIRDVLLQKCYKPPPTRPNRCLVLFGDDDERFVESNQSGLYSYWQLCLHLFGDELSEKKALRLTKKSKMHQVEEHPAWMVRLGHLARKLGFESDRILELCEKDPDLSDIRKHMLQERPHALFWASPDNFDLEALSRQKGQAIFQPRKLPSTSAMTAEDVTRVHSINASKKIFLPTIWSAQAQEKKYALTDHGRFVLVLVSFFGNFEPPSEWSGRPIPASRSDLHTFSNPPSPYHVNHTGSASEEPHLEEELAPRPCSSVYSLPDHTPGEPCFTSNETSERPQNLTFWHLPEGNDMGPIATHQCQASPKDIRTVIENIHSTGMAPVFTLVHRDNRLRLCHPDQILKRRSESSRPTDVYYEYSKDKEETWILKELPRGY